MKKVLNGIVVVVSLVCLFFPTVASATEVLEPNFEVLEPNIQILEPDTEGIASFRQKEAIVRNTGSQPYYYSPHIGWGVVTVLTWRTFWVNNGIAESGRTVTSIRRGFSLDTYFYAWSYRVW
ncbi:hypothetical protein [Enterococcus innesii]|jgi:hypothetical protein|uniref:hypothetical protein n=1 Tax=Enterococcus innesii TaxID=2839759 RepID=UPI0020909D15|nr:hypothetical protein [Enterococcus innesii]MCO5496232.1 hypothetical protein [Enterococcus innesii]